MDKEFSLRLEASNKTPITLRFAQPEVTIGRAHNNDIPLNNVMVSRRHCSLLQQDGRIIAWDNASTGGTFVNKRRIDHYTMRPGDLLALGDVTLQVILGPGEREEPASEGERAEALAEHTAPSRVTALAETGKLSLRRLIAARPDAPAALLLALSKSFDLQTLAALAQNPQSPLAALGEVAISCPEEVLENPAFPLLLLEDPNLSRFEEAALRALRRCPRCPEHLRLQAPP